MREGLGAAGGDPKHPSFCSQLSDTRWVAGNGPWKGLYPTDTRGRTSQDLLFWVGVGVWGAVFPAALGE